LLTGQENRERNVTTDSNLTYWVKPDIVVFIVVAGEKAALHRDVPFDVLN